MNKLKRFSAFLLTFIMVLQIMCFSAFANSKISINNITLAIQTIAIDDVAMVSIRDIYQCLGAAITWNGNTQEIVVSKEDKTIIFKVDSATAVLNNIPQTLKHSIVKKDGVAYMPIDFVAASLDIPINWNITDGIIEFTVNPEETAAVQERNNQIAIEKAEQERVRQAELARQQAEQEKARQAELARQQAEQEKARQTELARQQAIKQQSQTASTAPQSNTVYITRTGKRYHYDNSCNGGTYYPSTLEEAKSRGLTPCNKCV